MTTGRLTVDGQAFPLYPWFYLGTHMPNWLWDGQMSVPLFVSQRTLGKYGYDAIKPARVPWALDSGGFTELSLYGEWRLSPDVYVAMVADFDRTIGNLEWAAPQDWMCEPAIRAQTGLTVAEHQRRTVDNYLLLCELWPQYRRDTECPFIPVLQGWDPADYLRCADLYEAAGVDLEAAPLVGLGSVCRRQATGQIGYLIDQLAGRYRLHAFGCKTGGLLAYGSRLASADSMAWSFDARHADPLPGYTHQSCANCPGYAASWAARLAGQIDGATAAGVQDSLFSAVA